MLEVRKTVLFTLVLLTNHNICLVGFNPFKHKINIIRNNKMYKYAKCSQIKLKKKTFHKLKTCEKFNITFKRQFYYFVM